MRKNRPPLVPAPSTDLGSLIIRSLEDRWTTLHDLLEAVREKAATRKVHDLRVASRRMASIVHMVEEIVAGRAERKLGNRVEKLLKTLGELRDTQVQRKEVGDLAKRFPALEPFHERMKKRERELEPRVERKMRLLDMGKLQSLFEEVTADALLALSSEVLLERHRLTVLEAVNKRFSRLIDRRRALDVADLRTMHKMRVAFKKFRYMVEVLQPILVGMGKAQLDSMQAFQTMMGDVHDLDVLNQMVAAWRAEQGKSASNDLVAAQDDVGRQLLQKTDALVASADEIYAFWNQSYLPPQARVV